MEAKIKEIFTSIQGEGPFVGYKQLFVRFCGCNLKCAYCDTDFEPDGAKTYTASELAGIINKCTDCHSVSFTGGEPLLYQEFLSELILKINLPVYLETNGTLYDKFEASMFDFVSADIKLPSVTGMKPLWEEHEKFFSKAKNIFGKVVFNEDITDDEIERACEICRKNNAEMILQPQMKGDRCVCSPELIKKTLDKALKIYPKVRVIPQVHKYLALD